MTVAAGGLPIILTAPHGGRAAIPGVPDAKGMGHPDSIPDPIEHGYSRPEAGRRPGAEAWQTALCSDCATPPEIHRRESAPADAFESAEAKTTYEAYHAAIASACEEVTSRWGPVSCSIFTGRPLSRALCFVAHRTAKQSLICSAGPAVRRFLARRACLGNWPNRASLCFHPSVRATPRAQTTPAATPSGCTAAVPAEQSTPFNWNWERNIATPRPSKTWRTNWPTPSPRSRKATSPPRNKSRILAMRRSERERSQSASISIREPAQA